MVWYCAVLSGVVSCVVYCIVWSGVVLCCVEFCGVLYCDMLRVSEVWC